MGLDLKNSELCYSKDKWEYEEISEAQKQFIIDLAAQRKGYKLIVNIGVLTKGDASVLIEALLEDDNDKLVEGKVLAKVLSQEEFMKRVLEQRKIKEL